MDGYEESNSRLFQMIEGVSQILQIYNQQGERRQQQKTLKQDATDYMARVDMKLAKVNKKLMRTDKEFKTLEAVLQKSEQRKKENDMLT